MERWREPNARMMRRPLTVPQPTMKPPTQLTPKKMSGYVRIPAAPTLHLMCPKCRAENVTAGQHHVEIVADERGSHVECNVCAHAWDFRLKVIDPNDPLYERGR